VEVALDRPHGLRVVVDEDGARCPAREGLDPERAGTGEEVEHLGIVDRSDEVEDVLAHAVRGRPGVEPARRGELVPLAAAGDDAHHKSLERASPGRTWPEPGTRRVRRRHAPRLRRPTDAARTSL